MNGALRFQTSPRWSRGGWGGCSAPTLISVPIHNCQDLIGVEPLTQDTSDPICPIPTPEWQWSFGGGGGERRGIRCPQPLLNTSIQPVPQRVRTTTAFLQQLQESLLPLFARNLMCMDSR